MDKIHNLSDGCENSLTECLTLHMHLCLQLMLKPLTGEEEEKIPFVLRGTLINPMSPSALHLFRINGFKSWCLAVEFVLEGPLC